MIWMVAWLSVSKISKVLQHVKKYCKTQLIECDALELLVVIVSTVSIM